MHVPEQHSCGVAQTASSSTHCPCGSAQIPLAQFPVQQSPGTAHDAATAAQEVGATQAVPLQAPEQHSSGVWQG